MITRSILRPIRTRRIVPTAAVHRNDCAGCVPSLTAVTRNALATVGQLWVSFATSASSMTPASGSSQAPGSATY